MRARLAQVRNWSTSQLGLRAVVLLAPVLALLLAGPAGHVPPPLLVLAVVAGSVAFAAVPESWWGALVLATVVGWWCTVPDDGLGPLVLVAAVAVLAAHVAGLLASYGPGEALVEGALVRRWVVRGGLALVASLGVWLLAVGVRGSVPPGGLWTAGLVAALLALLVGSAALQ